jgi:hypothetical protein
MKAVILIFSMILSVCTTTQAQVSFGQPEKINGQWQFYLGDSPDEKTQWRTLDLPHDWSVEGVLNPSLAACTGYLPGGIARYRKQVFVPGDKQGKRCTSVSRASAIVAKYISTDVCWGNVPTDMCRSFTT